jgi:hypothetical protein
LFVRHVTQAILGCDFDFLQRRVGVREPVIHPTLLVDNYKIGTVIYQHPLVGVKNAFVWTPQTPGGSVADPAIGDLPAMKQLPPAR